MKPNSLLKSLVAGCSLVFAVESAQAVVVDTSLWTVAASPSYNAGPTGLTSAGGNQAVQNTNSYGTIVSDFSFTGDFNFSGEMTPTTASFSDNDILGLVFGWQDASNHYRLGWEAGGYNDNSGASGLFLVKEVAGVSSILFEQEIFWTNNTDYSFVVGRSGNDISFTLGGVSQTLTDTAFMDGNVGFYTESQTARFSGLTSAPEAPNAEIPEPGMLGIFAAGLIGLSLFRRRKTQ